MSLAIPAPSKDKISAFATDVEGVLILEPRVFGDPRGWFIESYNETTFAAVGIAEQFVQDNHSKSVQNVLRGLHYQTEHTQGKLVRAVVGEIYDVAVDLRRSSPTFGKWTSATLSSANKRMLWIPPGCAHGFLVLSPETEVLYKATDSYAPSAERTIIWNDQDLKIDWPLKSEPILSEKDRNGVAFANAPMFP
jgi:dTDP-4-dehydrorhamnose 3,5-epimerase